MTHKILVNEDFSKLSASEKKAIYIAELDNPAFWPSLTQTQREAELANIEAIYQSDLVKEKLSNEKPTLYVLNEVYLGVMHGRYLEVLIDRNKGGALHPNPIVTESDNLRVANKLDFVKYPLSGLQYYNYQD